MIGWYLALQQRTRMIDGPAAERQQIFNFGSETRLAFLNGGLIHDLRGHLITISRQKSLGRYREFRDGPLEGNSEVRLLQQHYSRFVQLRPEFQPVINLFRLRSPSGLLRAGSKIFGDLAGLPGGGLLQLLQLDQHQQIKDSLENGNYALALSGALDELGHFFEDPLTNSGALGNALRNGTGGTDLSSDVTALYLVLKDRSRLESNRLDTFRSLLTVQGKDPAQLAWWNNTLRALRQGPQQQAAFKAWLAKNGLDSPTRLRQLAAANPTISGSLLRGASIVDPNEGIWNLSGIPGINPDFIAALERCSQPDALSGTSAGYQIAMTCDKYSDGSYIPAFGSSRLTGAGRGAQKGPSGSIAGNWNILPGSYYTGTVYDPAMLQQRRKPNAGSESIRRIGPAQFQYYAQVGQKSYPVDLAGSDRHVFKNAAVRG
jgi:hypothetical protein